MGNNTDNRKVIKLTLPKPGKVSDEIKLPYNGKMVEEREFSFSFSCFDRYNELFNLDGNENGTVGGKWFIRLFDCLKSVSGKKIEELKRRSSTHNLHPVNWSSANVKRPDSSEQAEYWQFRLDKTHGRVIGILIDSIFYVVWLDPYHNLTTCEGHEKLIRFSEPKI